MNGNGTMRAWCRMQEAEQHLGTVRDYASSEHPITTIQNNMQSRVDVECHTDRRAAVCTEMTGNGSSMKLHQYGVIFLCLNPSVGRVGRTGLSGIQILETAEKPYRRHGSWPGTAAITLKLSDGNQMDYSLISLVNWTLPRCRLPISPRSSERGREETNCQKLELSTGRVPGADRGSWPMIVLFLQMGIPLCGPEARKKERFGEDDDYWCCESRWTCWRSSFLSGTDSSHPTGRS